MDSRMSRCSGILGASRVESIMIREEELEAQSEEDFTIGRKFAEAIGFDGSEVLVGTPYGGLVFRYQRYRVDVGIANEIAPGV